MSDITTEAEVSGPHRVVFDLPSGIDPTILANLRVFHKTGDPNNPTGTMLVDRTVDDTGGIFGLKINTEKARKNLVVNSGSGLTLTAEVDFLGQFVIALRPYLSPTSQDFPSDGGTGNIAVTAAANSNWTVISNDNFITVTSGNSGSASQTVSYSVAPNQSFRPRTGTITIAGQTFTVTQAGMDCSLTPTPIAIGQTINGELTLSDCLSSVRGGMASADRYSFSASAGNEVSIFLESEAFTTYLYLIAPDGTIIAESFFAIPEVGGFFVLPVSGTYIIEATSFFSDFQPGNYSLTLSGTVCAYSISPDNQSYVASGGSGSINVSAGTGCTWTAISNDSFITLSSGSNGNGNGIVSYNVATTSSANSRAGTITIAGQTFTITQQGAPPPCQITCPANLTVSNTAGQCGAVVNYAAPTITGNCGTVTCSPASGSFFSKGTTTVSCTTSSLPSCSFTVTIADTQTPSITCPANIVATAAVGQLSTIVTFSNPTAIDNCSGTSIVCSPSSGSTFSLGITTVTCTATDASGNQAGCTFKVAVSGTLLVNADSFLRDGADNTNEGANERLRIQSSGHNRVLAKFNLAGISTAGLQSAILTLNIAENSDNWGTTGRLVDAHRLLTDWTQGNGRNDVMVGGGPNIRGTGEGTTWKCAKDTNISNQNDDCTTPWNGGTFASATAAAILHINDQTGSVSWNVTADLQAGASYGWLIKKQTEGQNGQVRYYSREGAALAGNPSLAPRLVLVYVP